MEKGYKDIRYVKLQFTLTLSEDTIMPKNKNSALRGGMGEMLLRANCIRDRQCDKCDFENECIVRRTMYSRMEIQPAFMSEGDSVGYVIDCRDLKEHYEKDDKLIFYLTLFGKTIVYFSQYLNALFALGREGIGKNHSHFEIVSVRNSRGEPILDGMDVHMENYQVETLGDYIGYRKGYLANNGTKVMNFYSPLTLKYKGRFIQEFQIEAIIEAIKRRLYVLQCFEGFENDLYKCKPGIIPDILCEEHRQVFVKRHSNRKNDDVILKGIEGTLALNNVDYSLLELILAGEITHIGKNTSFGFGGYRISNEVSIKKLKII